MSAELESSLDLMLSGVDPSVATAVKSAVMSEVAGGSQHAKAIDYSIGLKMGEGFVFRYADLIGIDDVIDMLKEVGGGQWSPEVAAACVGTLLKFWSRLREVRVPVSADEVQVLRQIRKVPRTVTEIAAALGAAEADVQKTVDGLKTRSYMNGEVPLLSEDHGRYSTPF